MRYQFLLWCHRQSFCLNSRYIDVNQFKQLCELYMNNDIEAMYISFVKSKDYENGIIGAHACAIRSIDFSHNDNNLDWIEFCNPWDDNDCLRLSVKDFWPSSYRNIIVLGKNLSDFNIDRENGTLSLK